MEDQITGSVDKIVYKNEENGFSVIRLQKKPTETDAISLVGKLPFLQPGEVISCTGKWSHHPSYGRQFEVSSFSLSMPKDIKGLTKYLESGAIRGIGRTYAKRIVDAFGLETLSVLDNDPMRLLEIEGIGQKRALKMIERWKEQKEMRDVLIFLRSYNIGPALAQKIYKKWGQESIAYIKNNPYLLAKELDMVGFKTADSIAHELGIPKNSSIRIESGIEYVLSELSENGHTTFPENLFMEKAKETLQVDQTDIQAALISLEKEERILRKPLTTDTEPELHIWLRPFYFMEMAIAKHLDRILKANSSLRDVKIDPAIEWAQTKLQMNFAPEQQKAISSCLQNKVHIITGGPGTGKSTITKAILRIHEKLTEKILLCAPTGKAAKRMSEITSHKASTIHSLLEIDFQNGGFKRNPQNPLDCDLIIIDEASMIDTLLMSALLKAIPSHARVILIGDVDQLPSVGPGNVLKDLLETKMIFTTRLFQIFRQGKGSKIILNAHNINRGLFPDLSHTEESDFLFFDINDPEEIAEKILLLSCKQLPSSHKFSPFTDIQVLSPMRRGIIGIENLNVLLQEALNKNTLTLDSMGRKFKLGDKVMQIKNNYSKFIFNGDVGLITAIDPDEAEVIVTYDGKDIVYETNELNEITLAYAVSIHKYQGSESPCVIIPVHTTHYKLLQKNLLYTGITRGKKLVILLGTKKAIMLALKNDDVEKRFTGLSYFMKNFLGDHLVTEAPYLHETPDLFT